MARGSGRIIHQALYVTALAQIQKNLGVAGALGEIGVHHGRFFNVIAITARQGEQLFAADVFGKVEQNVDGSGLGNLEKFLDGASSFGIPRDDITIFEGSSDGMAFDHIHALGIKPFRMFSVDGGHTFQLTYADINWASCSMAKGGIVIVDDVGHRGWPGVDAGVYSSLACGPMAGQLVPFLFSGKLYLTQAEFHSYYYDALKNHPILGPKLIADSPTGNRLPGIDRRLKYFNWPILSPSGAFNQQGDDDEELLSMWESLGKSL